MKKEKYENPVIEVTELAQDDIITTSSPEGTYTFGEENNGLIGDFSKFWDLWSILIIIINFGVDYPLLFYLITTFYFKNNCGLFSLISKLIYYIFTIIILFPNWNIKKILYNIDYKD